MGFLQTAFLFSLAAVAIPVLLHLFSRWQTQKIELGTIRFLREVLTENVHRRRIRRWLLLTTRMLLLATLAFLFARPFFVEPTRRDGDRRRVILIDQSASMGMRGSQGKVMDIAVEKGIAAAKELGSDAKIDWAWFDSQVHPFQPRDGRPVAANAKGGSFQGFSNHGHTNYAAALSWARDRIAEDNREKSDVVLITDLQRRGMSDTPSIEFPADVPVTIIDVGRDAASNLAITRVELAIAATKSDRNATGIASTTAEPSKVTIENLGAKAKPADEPTLYDPNAQGSVRPDQMLYVYSTFFNYGPLQREDVPVIVTAKQGARTTRVKSTINASPEQASESRIELGRLGPGQWEIIVEADVDDDLSSDNRRVHAVSVDMPPRVLISGEASNEGSDSEASVATSTFYIDKALHQGIHRERPRFETKLVAVNESTDSLASSNPWSVVVLADATIANPSQIQIIEEYVRRGGHVLAFTGHLGGAIGAAMWNDSPIAPGRFDDERSAGVVPFRLAPNMLNHPALEPFDDPQSGDLQRLSFRRAISVRVDESVRELASFDRDLPGIVERTYGKGRVIWFLSDAGDAWSNWTSSPLYLPLIQQLVGDLAGLTGEGPIRFRTVGDAKLPASLPVQQTVQGQAVTQVAFAPSSQQSQSIPTVDALDSDFRNTGFVRDESLLYVVNTSDGESDTSRMTEIELRKAFNLSEPAASDSGTIANESASKIQAIKKQELWPWLAAFMFLLLVFEFGLSNRTPP